MILRLLIPLLLVTSARGIYPLTRHSAASPAQIRFAYENKFDDTGPGATKPEYAYKGYDNLDDALIAYLDDPDTQLPPNEKARAIANLYRNEKNMIQSVPFSKPKVLPIVLRSYTKAERIMPDRYNPEELRKLTVWFNEQAKVRSPDFRSSLKGFDYQYKPNPDVEFTVDVHDSETGDLKNAKELRDGSGTIHGYYSIVDHNGNTHSVQYETNPLNGLVSEVRRVL